MEVVEEEMEEEKEDELDELNKLGKELGFLPEDSLEDTHEEDSLDRDCLLTSKSLLVDSDKDEDSPMFGHSSKFTKCRQPQYKQRLSKCTRN